MDFSLISRHSGPFVVMSDIISSHKVTTLEFSFCGGKSKCNKSSNNVLMSECMADKWICYLLQTGCNTYERSLRKENNIHCLSMKALLFHHFGKFELCTTMQSSKSFMMT